MVASVLGFLSPAWPHHRPLSAAAFCVPRLPGRQNTAVWDICDDAPNNHEFWGLMRALFGYTCKPTPVEIIAYFLYWALAITFLCFKLHLG